MKVTCLFFVLTAFLLNPMSIAYSNDISEVHVEQYLEKRLHSGDKRYWTMLAALKLCEAREVKVMIETGTARNGDKNFVGDGGSTIIFGNWAYDHQVPFYSVDISPVSVWHAKEATKAYADFVEVVCGDSIEFLQNFDQPIDFLYLDSYDFELWNPKPSQEHHLKEIIAAYPKLHAQSIIMIDDCELPYGGKGTLVIDFLKQEGWKISHKGYQVIMVKSTE